MSLLNGPLSIKTLKRNLTQAELLEPYDPEYSGIKQQTEPWWKHLIHDVVPIVEVSKATLHPELEVRLGRFENRQEFRSGVKRDWFEYHLNKLQSSNVWANNPHWDKSYEYIFKNGVRVRGCIGGIATFIKKATIRAQELNIPLQGSTYHLRLVLKTEAPAYINTGVPTWVRFKQRMSFVYKNFSYDFTKVWEGSSIEEARASRPTYEIELECINLMDDTKYLAESLLMKCDTLLSPPPSFQPQQLQQQSTSQPCYTRPTKQYKNNTNQPNRREAITHMDKQETIEIIEKQVGNIKQLKKSPINRNVLATMNSFNSLKK